MFTKSSVLLSFPEGMHGESRVELDASHSHLACAVALTLALTGARRIPAPRLGVRGHVHMCIVLLHSSGVCMKCS